MITTHAPDSEGVCGGRSPCRCGPAGELRACYERVLRRCERVPDAPPIPSLMADLAVTVSRIPTFSSTPNHMTSPDPPLQLVATHPAGPRPCWREFRSGSGVGSRWPAASFRLLFVALPVTSGCAFGGAAGPEPGAGRRLVPVVDHHQHLMSSEAVGLIARYVRQISMDRLLYGADMHSSPDRPPSTLGWSHLMRTLPLTEAEFADTADNVAPLSPIDFHL